MVGHRNDARISRLHRGHCLYFQPGDGRLLASQTRGWARPGAANSLLPQCQPSLIPVDASRHQQTLRPGPTHQSLTQSLPQSLTDAQLLAQSLTQLLAQVCGATAEVVVVHEDWEGAAKSGHSAFRKECLFSAFTYLRAHSHH